MKTSYKIALIAAVALLALVLILFAGPSNTDPTTPESNPVTEQPKPEPRKSLVSESSRASNTPPPLATRTPAPSADTQDNGLTNDVRSRLRAAGAAQDAADRTASATPPQTDKPVNATALTNTDTSTKPEPVKPVTTLPPAPAVTQSDLDTILGTSAKAPQTPATSPAATARNTASTSPEPRPSTTIGGGGYVIQPGDTFSSIASEQYGDESRWFDIAQANPTVDPTRLRVGQELRLPGIESLKEHEEPVPAGPGSIQTYTIRPGDSLSTVAEQFYGDPTLWRVIYNFNRDKIGENPNAIQAGMSLKIPPRVGGAS